MSYRVSNGTGTSFNTAANWDEGVNAPSIHATTSITISATGVFSAVFTAPNLVNAATGVVVPVVAKGTAGTIIATLQQFSGAAWADVAGATATITITTLVASSKTFFEFTTPYVFTTLTAGYYRVKLNTSGATGTTSMAANSAGTEFSYLATMNSNVVPVLGDDVIIVSPNQGADLEISLDASPTIGSGTNTSVPAFRSWGNGLELTNNGILTWPTAASRTLTCRGNVLVMSGGEFRMGTTTSQIPAGITARFSFDQNGTTTNFGFVQLTGGIVSLQGAGLTYKKTTLSSGVGTAASPFVSADAVDWTVGDELLFVPVSNNAANYDEMETRFIITKNSTTSYVLSATSGGAEVAFTYSHTAGTVFNLTRRVLIDTTDTTLGWYGDFNEITTASNIDFDGFRLETYGGTTTGKTTIIFSNTATQKCQLDDGVFYRSLGSGAQIGINSEVRTFTWLIGYDHNGVGNSGMFLFNLRNKRFENCYIIDSQSAGFFPLGGSTCTYVNCVTWACGRASATASGGWMMSSTSNMSMSDCESHCNRTYGITFTSTTLLFSSDFLVGTKGTNGVSDVFLGTDGFSRAVFDNALLGSTTPVSNYTSAVDGTEVAFHKYNQTTNDHRWYSPQGIARSTGTGLSDTNVRTAGSLALRLAPEDSTTGFIWDFLILAKANSAVTAFGFIQKNTAFSTDDIDIQLYLPGLIPGVDTPSATTSMADDTAWNPFFLGANHTGSSPLYATVRVIAKTTTSAAYCYIDDLFNGTNSIIALDTWYQGKPSPIMYPELGDPEAVWAVLSSTQTTSGTMGKKHVDNLTRNQFIALD